MKKILLLFFILCIPISKVFSQQRCEADKFMEEQLKSSEFRKVYELRLKKAKERLEELQSLGEGAFSRNYIIPVAVHFPDGKESDRACLVELAKDQIRVLNEDFSNKNADQSQWEDAKKHYPNINIGLINFKFVLATKNHPKGLDNELKEGEPAVTIGYNFAPFIALTDENWKGYLNFFIKGKTGLGSSHLGGDPKKGTAVKMSMKAFGTINHGGCGEYIPDPSGKYDLGRTVTHEVGHQYSLHHPWGSGGCANDDGVADTPPKSSNTFFCPDPGTVEQCNEISLTTNYMDYVNDACMYMFTEGQAKKAIAYMDTIYDGYDQTTLSTNDFDINKSVSIFPNPAKNAITITSTSSLFNENTTIKILDLLGKEVKNIEITNPLKNHTISLSNINNGVYLIHIKSGTNSAIKKVVINK